MMERKDIRIPMEIIKDIPFTLEMLTESLKKDLSSRESYVEGENYTIKVATYWIKRKEEEYLTSIQPFLITIEKSEKEIQWYQKTIDSILTTLNNEIKLKEIVERIETVRKTMK